MQALPPDSDKELSPTRPSREVERRRMNNSELIQLFVYENGRQIDRGPRTRTFDTTEEFEGGETMYWVQSDSS